jgi:hypothetical protein
MLDNLIPIQDHSTLRRDLRTSAVVDVNVEGYKNYKKIREARVQEKERVLDMEQRINNMESDLSDIKFMLGKLLEK